MKLVHYVRKNFDVLISSASRLLSNLSWLDQRLKRALTLAFGVSFFWVFLDYTFFALFQLYLLKMGVVSSASAFFVKFGSFSANLLLLSVLFAGLMRALFGALKNHSLNMIYQSYLKIYRQQIFASSLADFRGVASFESVALFNETIFQAGGFWQNFSIVLANAVLALGLTAYAIVLYGANFVLCLVASTVAYSIISIALQRASAPTDRVVQYSHDLSKFLVESLKNATFIAIFRLQKEFTEQAAKKLGDYEQLYSKFSARQSFRLVTPQFVGMLVILGFCHWKFTTGYFVSYDFLGFFYIFFRIAQLMGETFGAIYLCKLNFPSSIKLQSWLDNKSVIEFETKPNNSSQTEDEFTAQARTTLKLSNVGYRYQHKSIFSSISLELETGDILAITGPSGSGKSTLVAAMLGLNVDYSGTIKFNSVEIRGIPYKYSTVIGYVGPTNFFIVDSIRSNLMLGHPQPSGISDDVIKDLLVALGLSERIFEKNGLDEILDENLQLSTGQQQRMAIARAILRRPVVLFLDEATANLDAESEARVADIVRKISPEIITIIVSHKGRILKLATKTIQLGNDLQ